MRLFLIDRVIEEEGLYVYTMYKEVEKPFSIRIAPVRSRVTSS
jgi:hypothetical protein